MERAERRLDAEGDVSLWEKRPRARIADSAGPQSRADLLSFLQRILIRPAIHAIKPRDSESAGSHAYVDGIAGAEAVVIIRVNGETLNAMPGAPGRHEKTPRAAHHTFHLIAAIHNRGVELDTLGGIQPPVQYQCGQKNEGNRNQPCEQMPDDYDFFARAGPALQYYGQRERHKKHHAEENKHAVKVQRWINLADVRKQKRAGQKDGHLTDQPAAEDKFRGGGGQSADRALIAGAF